MGVGSMGGDSMGGDSMGVREAIRRGAAELREAGTGSAEEAAREAAILLSYCMGVDLARLYMLSSEAGPPASAGSAGSAVGADALGRFRAALERRRAREPLQYITGVQEFMSLEFLVDRRVLIPRPETEILVEALLDFAGGLAGGAAVDPCAVRAGGEVGCLARRPVFRFADVGTGSGAIAVSVARYASAWMRVEGYATDISADALAVAGENAARHGVAGDIMFFQGNLLEPVARVVAPGSLDAVASNPPYVEPGDWASLQPEVRLFEPAIALRCEDPVAMCGAIAAQAADLLRRGGLLAVEVGAGQARRVAAAFEGIGAYGDVRIIRDLAGIERVVCCRRRRGGRW